MIFFYNLLVLTWGLCILPVTLWQRIVYGKYRGSFLKRLGFGSFVFIKRPNQPTIWIHAVSLGETKAVGPLIEEIRKDMPQANLFFSSTTETGQEFARKNNQQIDKFFFLPLDLSWIMKKVVRSIDPTLFILVETDFWLNLMSEVKSLGAKIVLVNGKLSDRSYKRYKLHNFFSKRLFSLFDQICSQSKAHSARFHSLGVEKNKIVATGNLKFDVKDCLSIPIDIPFEKNATIITIASTHEKEEELLLKTLLSLDPSIKILLAPRHPERFKSVARFLKTRRVPYAKLSGEKSKGIKVLLIDKMGVLDQCYRASKLVIMGGSFVKKVGGHNIIEPVQYGVPVIFGPYMDQQKKLVQTVLSHCFGEQVSLEKLGPVIEKYLSTKHKLDKGPLEEFGGATERSWEKIKSFVLQNEMQ